MKPKKIDLIGDYEHLIEVAHRRKLQWFGHTTRRPGSLACDVLVEDARGRGRPNITWLTDIAEWTGIGITCVRGDEDRQKYRKIVKS